MRSLFRHNRLERVLTKAKIPSRFNSTQRLSISERSIGLFIKGIGLLGATGVGAYVTLSASPASTRDGEFRMEQVAEHDGNGEDGSYWIVIDGKVYDVTSFLDHHPGGSGILRAFAGKDVSKEFKYLQHSKRSEVFRSGLHIGNVIDYKPPAFNYDSLATETQDDDQQQKEKVVIVGAGICGVAAAYYLSLSKKKQYDITVVEKAPMVGGTALKSSAILFLGGLVERSDVKNNITQWSGWKSLDIVEEIQNEWGEDIGLKKMPIVGVIDNEDIWKEKQNAKMRGNTRLLPIEELLKIEPLLNPSLYGGTVTPAATFDPFNMTNALAKQAKANGVKFLHGLSVADYSRKKNADNGKDDGEQGFTVTCQPEEDIPDTQPLTDNIKLECDKLVICTGWMVPQLAGLQSNVPVPVEGMHGQMGAIQHPEVKLNCMLYSHESARAWRQRKSLKTRETNEPVYPYKRFTRHLYATQLCNGIIKVGGDRLLNTEIGGVLPDGIRVNYQHLCEVIPKLKECSTTSTLSNVYPQHQGKKSDESNGNDDAILGSWYGIMPFTPDQQLIVGELEQDLFVVTGAPFTKGALAGELVADSIEGGTKYPSQLERVSPHRFKPKSE